jgi:hypothetical protein
VPLAKPVYFLGEEQALKAALSALSRLHSNVEPASEEKVNVADLVFTVSDGPELISLAGIGTDHAATLLIVAGDNPKRLKSNPSAWKRDSRKFALLSPSSLEKVRTCP